MKNLKSFIVIIIMLHGIFGQKNDKDQQQNHLQPNIRAIQFGITDYFRFTSFTGSCISLKKHFSREKAIRIGLSLTNSFYDENGDRIITNTRYDTLYYERASKINDLYKNKYFGLSIEYVMYLKSMTDLYPYIGIGTKFIYSGQTYKKDNFNNYREIKTDKSTTISAGIILPIGIEYFIKQSISFHCEYISGFYIGKRFKERKVVDYYPLELRKTIDDSDEPYYNLNSYIQFGASFYF